MRGLARSRPLWAVLALVAGLCLRLWFVGHHLAVDGDGILYSDIAKNLLASHIYGFTQDEAQPLPTLIRLPGYPLFLALCFRLFGIEHFNAVRLVQSAVDLAACSLLAALAGRLFCSRNAALTALVAGALCPLTAVYTGAVLTETLTLASIVITFYALFRWTGQPDAWNRWLWLTAAALGVSLLLRPEQGLLAATVLPAMAWAQWHRRPSVGGSLLRSLVPVLACALAVLVPLAPWVVRNAITFHVFEPLAPRSATDPGEPLPTGFNSWFRSWAIDFGSTEDVYWNYDGNTIDLDDLPSRVADNPQQLAATRRLIEEYNQSPRLDPEIDTRFAALARERIQGHRLRFYVLLPIARLANMLFRPRTELLAVPLDWWHYREHPRWTLIASVLALVNLLYITAGVAGAVRWWRRSRCRDLRGDQTNLGQRAVLLAALWFVALRCGLLLTLDNSEPRYTLEFFPLLILAASALAGGLSRSSDRSPDLRQVSRI